MTLTVYLQLVRALVDNDWRPDRALIRRELTDRHHGVREFEECRASFRSDLTALAIPTAFLSRLLPKRFQATKDHSQRDWQFGPEGSEPIVEKLHRLLASSFTCRTFPTLEQVAKTVDTSEATLKRQLAAAGITYRRLLDRLRFDEARRMLSTPTTSVKEVAFETGYADTSNFVRSFRRMTGITPNVYRNQQMRAVSSE